MRPLRFLALAPIVALAAACNPPQKEADAAAQTRTASAEPRAVAVTGHELASEAAAEILRRGGSAIDAAVAAQMVLTLVEPQSSGIGGGAFLMRHDGATGALVAYDGREVAPMGATPDLFLREDGAEMDLIDAVVGGHSVGVPGVVAMLAEAHADHGVLPWAELFEPAIRLSEEGFPVSERLSDMIKRLSGRGRLDAVPDTAGYFYDVEGNALEPGHILKNPALAESLRLIAENGAAGFYEGPVAEAIVASASGTDIFPSTMTLEDLANYEPRKVEPICAAVFAHRVCTMPPPSSGSILLELLGVLDRTDIAREGGWTARSAHLFAEASRLAYADQDMHMADDRVTPVPTPGLIDPAYHESRAALIDPETAMAAALAGDPPGGGVFATDASPKPPSTSHMTIADADGNVVTMTTTVEFPFGSHLMAGGFILNNQLTDFAFRPEVDGRPTANAVAPGKKPRSSMVPAVVYDADGRLVMATGSPGGTGIIAYVAKTVLARIGWGLSLEDAVAAPNIVARRGRVWLEEGRFEEALNEALKAKGHGARLGERLLTSGVNSVAFEDGRAIGAADPRREGAVVYVTPPRD